MKRGMLCFVFVAFFTLPTLAAAEVHGVYFAPRFLLGIQNSGPLSQGNDMKQTGTEEALYSQHSQAVVGGALALGFNFGPKFGIPIRTEVEFALRSNSESNKDGTWDQRPNPNPAQQDYGTWSTKMTHNLSTLFLNAYFDIPTGTSFTPYIGGGLGMAFNYTSFKFSNPHTVAPQNTDDISLSKHATTFAWNVGAGLSYAFTENVAADLGYRFIATGYNEVKESLNNPPYNATFKIGSPPYIHEFYLGARFTF